MKQTTNQLIQKVYRDSALSSSQVSKRLKLLRKRRKVMIDNLLYGRPSTSHIYENVTRVQHLLNSDLRICVTMTLQTLNPTTVQTIMTNDLNVQKVWRPLVHKMLRTQEANRLTIANEFSKGTQIEPDCCYRGRNKGIWERTRDKATECRMAHLGVPQTKEGKNEQVKSQNNAGCLFQC